MKKGTRSRCRKPAGANKNDRTYVPMTVYQKGDVLSTFSAFSCAPTGFENPATVRLETLFKELTNRRNVVMICLT